MYFSAMQKDTFGDIIHIIRIDSIYYLFKYMTKFQIY